VGTDAVQARYLLTPSAEIQQLASLGHGADIFANVQIFQCSAPAGHYITSFIKLDEQRSSSYVP
jgi:hypothetical protein